MLKSQYRSSAKRKKERKMNGSPGFIVCRLSSSSPYKIPNEFWKYSEDSSYSCIFVLFFFHWCLSVPTYCAHNILLIVLLLEAYFGPLRSECKEWNVLLGFHLKYSKNIDLVSLVLVLIIICVPFGSNMIGFHIFVHALSTG